MKKIEKIDDTDTAAHLYSKEGSAEVIMEMLNRMADGINEMQDAIEEIKLHIVYPLRKVGGLPPDHTHEINVGPGNDDYGRKPIVIDINDDELKAMEAIENETK